MIVAYGFISLTLTPSSPPVRKPPSSFFLYSHPIAMLINPGNPCDARAKTPSTAQKLLRPHKNVAAACKLPQEPPPLAPVCRPPPPR